MLYSPGPGITIFGLLELDLMTEELKGAHWIDVCFSWTLY
jgi:hypothetical protein